MFEDPSVIAVKSRTGGSSYLILNQGLKSH